MRYFSIIERSTKEATRVFAEKNFREQLSQDHEHPQEDYLIASASPPIFVVADGVTLDFRKLADRGVKYPSASPAGEVAKIFCQTVIRAASNCYDEFKAEKVIEVFGQANDRVGAYNRKVGKSDFSGNITGFYAATGAFVVVKDKKAYWASICDSFVAHFDKEMRLKFLTSSSCTPYAVINGQERMVEHLERGVFELEESDRVFVFTDGFEHFVRNEDFLRLFKDWGGELQEHVVEFSQKMNLEDPEKYGHERSLIAILD